VTAGGCLAALLLAACAGDAEPGGPGAAAAAAVDWRTTTYTLTCDGVVPGGFRAPVVDGSARVTADGSREPFYDHYEVRVQAVARGDLDGDAAADAVVLLECSPQPSNGILQEVLLLSASGRPLGVLPSPRTLQGEAPLPPVHDPAGLSVADGEIVTRMLAYAPTDSHADGPSVPTTVRWRVGPQGVVRVSSP
jgi:hypothetical protein